MPVNTWSAHALRDLLLGGALVGPQEINVIVLWPQATGGFENAPPSPPVATSPSPTRTVLRAAPRSYLLLGDQVTPRGVAAIARRQILECGVMALPADIHDAEDSALGAAIFRVATELTFGTSRALVPVEADAHWTIGTLLPLPFWATDTAGTRTWHLDVDRLRAALAVVAATATSVSSETAGASQPTRELHAADAPTSTAPFQGTKALVRARELRMRLETAAAGTYDATAEGGRWAQEALWNPYAVLFALLENSLALDIKAPAKAATFAAGFWSALTAPERAVLAQTSAGHVWLRRLWTWWGRPTAPAADKSALRALLGLANDDLATRAPGSVGELEPPMFGYPALPVPSRTTVKTDLPVMAFGRRIEFVGGAYPLEKEKWANFGVRYQGTVTPAQYFVPDAGVTAAIDPALFPGVNAAVQATNREQWTRILAAISVTEGCLDAATSWDRAMASLGCQQFSMHEPKEGAALLERLKNVSPVYYDVVVRSLGIETGVESGASPAPSAAGAGAGDLDQTGCFFTLTSTAGPVHHYAPGGTGDAAISDVRANVFDWVQNPDRTFRAGKRAIMLCARWAAAGRYALELWQAQAELSVHRIARTAISVRADGARWAPVLALPTIPVTSGGTPAKATVVDLFGTEALMGLAVDMMINTPGHLNGTMRRAVARTLAALQSASSPSLPLPLDQVFFDQLLLAFLAERYYTTAKGTSMTRGSVIDVVAQRLRLLVPTIGSAGSTRSAALDAVLSRMLVSAGIGPTLTMSPVARVNWP